MGNQRKSCLKWSRFNSDKISKNNNTAEQNMPPLSTFYPSLLTNGSVFLRAPLFAVLKDTHILYFSGSPNSRCFFAGPLDNMTHP